MKSGHSTHALPRGPPVLIRARHSGNAAATAGDRMCPGHPSSGRSGVPILQARVQDADIAGLPREISREGPFLCLRNGRIHNLKRGKTKCKSKRLTTTVP